MKHSIKLHWWRKPHIRKRLLITGVVLISLLIIGNMVLWMMYRNRTYPRTQVFDVAVGSVAYDDLFQKMSQMELLPDTLTLQYDTKKTTSTLRDVGVTKDLKRATDSAARQRSWLPMINLFTTTELEAPVHIDDKVLQNKAGALSKIFHKDATNAHLELADAKVTITKESAGFDLNHSQLAAVIQKTLDTGKTSVTVPVTVLVPKVKQPDLKDDKAALEAQLKMNITYRYEGKTRRASPSEITAWFSRSGEIYALSPDKIQTYISSVGRLFGIRVKDIGQMATRTQQALTERTPLDLTLTHQAAAKTFTYCVAAKGVSTSYLPAFRSKLQSALNAPRGWSLNGLVEFREVSGGCDYTAWLTAANLMPTFGEICDSTWSCRIGPNVVINFDRWQNASPSWNAAGGALDEYRNMVINHETGHWLGFGHSYCPGAGQAAPVMQQQSINLQGCRFNAWPTGSEQAVLRRSLGL